jgi:hypothetical protein
LYEKLLFFEIPWYIILFYCIRIFQVSRFARTTGLFLPKLTEIPDSILINSTGGIYKNVLWYCISELKFGAIAARNIVVNDGLSYFGH